MLCGWSAPGYQCAPARSHLFAISGASADIPGVRVANLPTASPIQASTGFCSREHGGWAAATARNAAQGARQIWVHRYLPSYACHSPNAMHGRRQDRISCIKAAASRATIIRSGASRAIVPACSGGRCCLWLQFPKPVGYGGKRKPGRTKDFLGIGEQLRVQSCGVANRIRPTEPPSLEVIQVWPGDMRPGGAV